MEYVNIIVRLLSYSFLVPPVVSLIWGLTSSPIYAAIARTFGFNLMDKRGMKMIRLGFIFEGIVAFILTYYIFSMFQLNSAHFNNWFYLLIIFPISLYCVMPEQNYKTQKDKSRSNFPNEYLRQRPAFRKRLCGFLLFCSVFFFVFSIQPFSFKIPFIFENLEVFSWWIFLHGLLAFTHLQIAITIYKPIEINEYFTIVDYE